MPYFLTQLTFQEWNTVCLFILLGLSSFLSSREASTHSSPPGLLPHLPTEGVALPPGSPSPSNHSLALTLTSLMGVSMVPYTPHAHLWAFGLSVTSTCKALAQIPRTSLPGLTPSAQIAPPLTGLPWPPSLTTSCSCLTFYWICHILTYYIFY